MRYFFSEKYLLFFVIIGLSLNLLGGLVNLNIKLLAKSEKVTAISNSNYEKFEQAVEKYLSEKSNKNLISCRNTAQAILLSTGDKYPTEQIEYYSHLSNSNFNKIAILKAEAKEFELKINTISADEKKNKSRYLIEEFTKLKSPVDLFNARLLLARSYPYDQDLNPASLILKQNLIELEKNNYLAIKARFLFYLASTEYNSENAAINFKALISLCEQLKLDKLKNQAELGLVKFYELNNNDSESNRISKKLLNRQLSNVGEIVNLQMLAMTSTKLNNFDEAKEFTQLALDKSIKAGDSYNISLTHLIAAIMWQKFNHKAEASVSIVRAENNLNYNKLSDPEIELLTLIYCQKAKIEAEKGNSQAANLQYIKALNDYTRQNKSNLLLSSIYLSIAKTTNNQSLQKKYREMATSYRTYAETAKETKYSDFFSFVPDLD